MKDIDLTAPAMSDMMFDMKRAKVMRPAAKMPTVHPDSFTVRDLSRNAAAVLSASLAHGQVRIRSRAGPVFLLMPDKSEELMDERAKTIGDFAERQRAYREQLRALGSRPPATVEETERIHRLIAGEE